MKLRCILLVLSILTGFASNAIATHAITPITNCAELQAITTDDMNGHYELTRELDDDYIDCSDIIDFQPIGQIGNEFTGHFDGNGVPIKNLTIIRPKENDIGLFGAIAGNVRIENVVLVDAHVAGKEKVGLLVGTRAETLNYGTSELLNNKVQGQLSGMGAVGGLIGNIDIANDPSNDFPNDLPLEMALLQGNRLEGLNLSNGKHSYSYFIGGLVGYAEKTDIKDNVVTGEIIAISHAQKAYGIGGLVGVFNVSQFSISDSQAHVNVTASTTSAVGGLVGKLSDSYSIPAAEGNGIKNSAATGKIEGRVSVGGLVGDASASTDTKLVIHQSYATGDVFGGQSVGGLLGSARHVSLTETFSTGDVGNPQVLSSSVGGLVGASMMSELTNVYAQGKVSGHSLVGGLIGFGNDNLISHAYATGEVNGVEQVGGLMGGYPPFNRFVQSYWDMESTGVIPSNPLLECDDNTLERGCAANTHDLQSQAFYTSYTDWDFTKVWQEINADEPAQYPQFKFITSNNSKKTLQSNLIQ